ncbi:NACHT domain-containing protein [Bradyrhizobium sp. UNPA324]|uniref:NACHT domain-containing protein n=1 Tax=Bradyrhizobium sp. UNPA324 TaxID=1141174 RepID=UPI00114D664F|nr:NACHT domain-containing protein [Bradyrhizobium sp. UNPA324]TQF28597.1 hypothetical protein UNPA324_02235 [Bradyrhizobium sp. UNPA324]
MNEPNINEIAATVIQGQISNALSAVSKTFKSAVAKVLEIITKDLTRYTASKIKKCSHVKTPIINRDHSVYIFDIYVQTRLKTREHIVRDDSFIETLANNDSVVISGSAGSGKSMFMRYLFLKLCNEKRSKIPLFFELRDINVSDKKDLQKFLYYNLIGSSATISESQFLDSLKAGVFSLILDGFDEINHTDRKEIESQIRKLREQCPDLQIIVSSRPDSDQRTESWQTFRTVYVQPMEEYQFTELIEKLRYDAKIKEKFLRDAKGVLFQTHKTFLSNPLLCIMMLVTFAQTGHIPTKRHVFYERAFDALFALHDTAKEGVYKRKTYSDLSIDDFRNCLSAFCIITYLKEQLVFSRTALREALRQALELEKLKVNIDDVINDMVESTCLIQVEGTDFVFTHRSFQEYFAAVFISRSPAAGVGTLLDLASRRRTDDVVNLAFSINRGLIEREWIIPTLDQLLGSSTARVAGNAPIRFLKEHIGGVILGTNSQAGASIGIFFAMHGTKFLSIANLYRNSVPGIASLVFEAGAPDRERANAAYVNMVRTRDHRLLKSTRVSDINVRSRSSIRASNVFELTEADGDWIMETSIPTRVTQFLTAAQEVLDQCKAEAQTQVDVLRMLTPRGY